MPRADLLALSLDDLSAITNRGTVKRAQRELESGEVTFELSESDAGDVVVKWSDDTQCTLPSGKTASDGKCTCPATTLCRHVIRSILAYQVHANKRQPADAPPEAWDPGEFTDEQLAAQFKKNVLTGARTRFEQGLLIELVRSSKPSVRFHQLACALRFIVRGDLRYTHCDCAEPAPCSHVPMAVWAFRMLAPEKESGLISTQSEDLPVPSDLLDTGETLLSELVESGLSSISPTWCDRAKRLQVSLSDVELIWPAQVVADLAQQVERYQKHDARFSPARTAELLGEWIVRSDAIRNNTRAVPQLLVRGSTSDRTVEIGAARYVGVGCDAAQDRAGVTITAYLQDVDSGSVVAVSRDFTDPAKDSSEEPKTFAQLASTNHFRGISLASLGAGQLLLQGGKRAPDHQLFVGRARASMNPQGYRWESLRSPLLVEDFAELRARLAFLPPACLRPRYLAENLYVLPIAKVEQFHFNEASQTIEIIVQDSRGELARIEHPYSWRGRFGSEALLKALNDNSRKLCFVAGRVSSGALGILIHPVTLVFEGGATRIGIQPWVDGSTEIGSTQEQPVDQHRSKRTRGFLDDLLNELGELSLIGLRRADAQLARRWTELAKLGESLGFHRLVIPVRLIADELSIKLRSTSWQCAKAKEHLVQLTAWVRLSMDLQEDTTS